VSDSRPERVIMHGELSLDKVSDAVAATLDELNVNTGPSVRADAHGDVEHLVPRNASLGDVELSIVVPALNEEITVGEFIEWCKEGLKRSGVRGQILIVDSSTDDTARIVLEHGGEVL